MAEIRVEPKKHTPNTNWIWIVLVLLIAAAVVYYFVSRDKNTNNAKTPDNTTGAVIQAPMGGKTAFTNLQHHTVMHV